MIKLLEKRDCYLVYIRIAEDGVLLLLLGADKWSERKKKKNLFVVSLLIRCKETLRRKLPTGKKTNRS